MKKFTLPFVLLVFFIFIFYFLVIARKREGRTPNFWFFFQKPMGFKLSSYPKDWLQLQQWEENKI